MSTSNEPYEALQIRLEEYAKLMIGKPAFSLESPRSGVYKVDARYYKGRIKTAKIDFPKILINTDIRNQQYFDRHTEIVEDGTKMVCDKEGYSTWVILLKKPIDFITLDCNLCLSTCKKDKPCSLIESAVNLW